MQNLDGLGFKFKVGEVVNHRLIIRHDFKDATFKRTPLLIIERGAVECSGGVQLFYECRCGVTTPAAVMTMDPARLYRFHELELEPAQPE